MCECVSEPAPWGGSETLQPLLRTPAGGEKICVVETLGGGGELSLPPFARLTVRSRAQLLGHDERDMHSSS